MIIKNSRKWIIVFTFIGLSLFIAPSRAYPPMTEVQSFHMGVYLYDYQLEQVAKEHGQEYFSFLEKHLKILQQYGVNTIYLGGANRELFGRSLELFAKYDMTVIPQLDFAYYKPTWNDKQIVSYAKVAGDFINKYADNPNILAFSVCEEVPHNAVNGLARYYAAILAEAPKARFQLINSNLGSANDLPVPDPAIMGTDRYGFWFEISGGGYLATPRSALNWVRSQADSYYQQSARRGADFSLVVTQGGMMMPRLAKTYAGDGKVNYPKTKKEQEELQQRVRTFAANGHMGWGEFNTPQGKRYNLWKYYRLPANTMKALAWTAVLQGAKSFYIWSYMPPSRATLDSTFKSSALAKEPMSLNHWITLAGRPGIPNPQLTEFGDASREILAYGTIINRMNRSGETLIQTDYKGIFHNAFMLPKFKGRIVVLQNSNVGTWNGTDPGFFTENDDVRIDNEGNLVGWKGLKKPSEINFTLANKDDAEGVYDIKTGKKLIAINTQYTVSIMPGSGTLIFIGHKEEAQLLKQEIR